jgi:hypothetical protein
MKAVWRAGEGSAFECRHLAAEENGCDDAERALPSFIHRGSLTCSLYVPYERRVDLLAAMAIQDGTRC